MPGSDAIFARRLLKWYDANRRDLPWRRPIGVLPDPYHVLLSETMLQQTQVATVVPYFHRFLEKFPTIGSLSRADLHDVLRLWQGLGYYSRARNLHRAAGQVTTQFAGRIPSTLDELLTLPGVGRYTAGAISSLAFDMPAPILDGNVRRVLCRLDAVIADPRLGAVNAQLWDRAGQILPKRRVGDSNSALMELGAMICTPRNPQCLLCPVNQHCQALADGIAEQIPLKKKSKPTPLHRRNVYCIRHHNKWLIEQRPAKGRWAGMWQFVTVGEASPPPQVDAVKLTTPRLLGSIAHALTHRRYEFTVYLIDSCSLSPVLGGEGWGEGPGRKPRITSSSTLRPSPQLSPLSIGEREQGDRRWVTLDELKAFPLPRPHLKVAEMISEL